MCGIIGQVGELEESISFSKYMYRRGPDCQKVTRKGKVQFGHALLAIQGSNPIVQPIEGKNSLLSFNGEIYNWHQIQKKRLELIRNVPQNPIQSDVEKKVFGCMHPRILSTSHIVHFQFWTETPYPFRMRE